MFGISITDPCDGLLEISFLLKRHQGMLGFDAEELDRIVDEYSERDAYSSICEHSSWFPEFLPALNMWWGISDSILGSQDHEGDYKFTPEPCFEKQRERLSSLLKDVLDAYVPASRESIYYSGVADGFPASLELLKRYRLCTRYICDFAKEVWPRVNLKALQKA